MNKELEEYMKNDDYFKLLTDMLNKNHEEQKAAIQKSINNLDSHVKILKDS